MRPIPQKLRLEIAEDLYYKKCARSNCDCNGRITLEHAFIYAGKQINEKWAIIPLCVYHHLGDGLIKKLNQYIALSRADIDDLCRRMPKKNWQQEYKYLTSIYGNKKV